MSSLRELVRVEDVRKYFPIKGGLLRRNIGYVHAVDGVSFSIRDGETLGLAGESGCGKSTLGRTILGLIKPTSGDIYFTGQSIFELSKSEMRKLRGKMQIIFQDPESSLNPRLTVGSIIGEAFEVHDGGRGEKRRERILELLSRVGLDPEHIDRYPHEFSGGQKQRIGIARALAVNPKFIVADEPVSALDVSVRAQIINLLEDLKGEFKLTLLFIAHDLSVIQHVSDRVAIMYLGKIMELAPVNDLFTSPQHPYTEALISAVPTLNPDDQQKRIILKGDVPSPINPPPGCRFHTRCKYAMKKCKEVEPKLVKIDHERYVRCHLRA